MFSHARLSNSPPPVQKGVGKGRLFCTARRRTRCRSRCCCRYCRRCCCRRNTRCCCRRRSSCCCRCQNSGWGRCRCRSRCRGRCRRRLAHGSSKTGFIILLTDLLHFRVLKRDDAAGASVLHFNRATLDALNFLRVIRIARLRIRHLVIGGTSNDKEPDAQTYDKPSIPHRPFHGYFSLHIYTAVDFRLARREQ